MEAAKIMDNSGEAVLERVRRVLGEVLKIDGSTITTESRFIEDLKADSLDMATLLLMLEDEFGGSVPDDQARAWKTVGDVVEFLKSAK